MKCPNCNHENSLGAKFCNQCGTKLPVPLECPVCHSKNIPKDSNFCPDCGAPLNVAMPDSDMKTIVLKGVSIDMIHVKGGTFTMGGTPEQGRDAFDNEYPTHQVALRGFYIGKYEVTQDLWQTVMGDNPSHFKGANLPVESVSWNDCQKFISRLNSLTGKTFRLPTEAEWEYAARGGNKSRGYKYSGSNNIDSVAWYDSNSGSKTHEVGKKQANELGIYDMTGNVWEWCQDWYGNYGSGSQSNPTGANSGSYRVTRGGFWNEIARYCRSSYRSVNSPGNPGGNLGLRLVLSE